MFVIMESSSFLVSFFTASFHFFCTVLRVVFFTAVQFSLERRVYVDGCSENLGNETSDEPS
jgi:hypothetical protein